MPGVPVLKSSSFTPNVTALDRGAVVLAAIHMSGTLDVKNYFAMSFS